MSQSVSSISMPKTSCDSKNVENLDTFISVRRPKHSGVIWKKKGSSNTSNVDLSYVSHLKLNENIKRYSRKDLLSCNNSHLGETSSAYVCNDAMNVSCNSRLCDLFDENNLFIFDDESFRISPVSKMTFRKKPRVSMNVCSKSNSNKSLPRTVHKWLPKLQPMGDLLDDNNFFIFDDESVRISPVSKMPFRKNPRDSMNIVQIYLWIINSGCSKHMMGNRALLTSFVEKFLGTVRFGNNDFEMIAGYEDVVIGSMTIKKVYYVEGLGHNLFSVGQFFDKGLEVAFRKSTCFVQNEDGVDLLTCDRLSNLYTIALNEVASNSSTCLLAKASSSQSWLWHQRLSHLNCATINNLVKNNLVQVIAGYGDVVIGSMTIKRVYYLKGLGHNLFNVGQFCDKGLEVAFRKSTCFVRNEDGVDLLTGDHSSNSYTIALNEVASNSSIFSQVFETSKKDLEDLFQDFYDEYFDSSKIMKSSTTNVETSINEEVFHEVSESFQGESSSSSLNDDVQQSPEEVILPSSNTQSIPINMANLLSKPNGSLRIRKVKAV
nr:integrase, catalytic region, zinc finger, CCHC-type, peptidase aspartic, catalytic [Tanacetum cinerariifolium]